MKNNERGNKLKAENIGINCIQIGEGGEGEGDYVLISLPVYSINLIVARLIVLLSLNYRAVAIKINLMTTYHVIFCKDEPL